MMDMDAADVPHFMDKTPGKGEAPDAHASCRAWLAERGIVPINVLFVGEHLSPELIMESVSNVNSKVNGLTYLLSGTSRTGVNHCVVCQNGEIVCDPSTKNSGIVGPCDDGYYWVTFFGSVKGGIHA